MKHCLGPMLTKDFCGDGTDFWVPCVVRQWTCGYFSDANYCIFLLNARKNAWRIGYAINRIRLYQQITGKHSEKFLKNATNKNLLKIKRINTKIQANRGAHFLHVACQGGWRAPLHPCQLRHCWYRASIQTCSATSPFNPDGKWTKLFRQVTLQVK